MKIILWVGKCVVEVDVWMGDMFCVGFVVMDDIDIFVLVLVGDEIVVEVVYNGLF